VDPDEVASGIGATITVTGTRLDLARTAAMVLGGATLALEDWKPAVGGLSATARVPAGQAGGVADLQLAGSFPGHVRLAGAFRVVEGELQIEAFDIGEGDATLIRAPGGRAMLVDGGRARFPGGPDSCVPHLLTRGARPAFVMPSHFDADHLGGIVDWLRGPDATPCTDDDRVPSGGLLDYTRTLSTCNSNVCLDYYRLKRCLGPRLPGGGSVVPEPGDAVALGGGVRVTVAAVNGRLMDGTELATGSDNANSIALLVEFGEFRFLTAGDTSGGPQPDCPPSQGEADVETPLGKAVGRVAVLHTIHHGSCTANGAALLAEVLPQAAIVSAGLDNAYGHPAQAVLDRFAAAGVRLFLTSPGQTGAGPAAATRLPESAEKVFGTVRIATSDGRAYRVEMLGPDGSVRVSRPFDALDR